MWNGNLLAIVSAFRELLLIPIENCGQKDKNGPKIDKKNLHKNCVVFLYIFRILLKFWRVVYWGARPPVAPPLSATRLHTKFWSDVLLQRLSGNFGVLARYRFVWSSRGGPIIVPAPVRPNMLNMPKSASDYTCTSLVYDLSAAVSSLRVYSEVFAHALVVVVSLNRLTFIRETSIPDVCVLICPSQTSQAKSRHFASVKNVTFPSRSLVFSFRAGFKLRSMA